eukprot:gene11085-12918_t
MSSTTCSICLATAQARGGVALMAPGCCGAWYHQTCIDNVIAAGGRNCPMCRQALPLPAAPALPIAAVPNVAPAAPASRGGIFGFFGSARNNSALPPTNNIRAAPFYSSTASFTPSVSEDLLTALTVAAAAAGPVAVPTMTVSASPEFPELSRNAREEFYARVSLKYEDVEAVSLQKVPVDIVCVLDNSGSMQGSKISSLKKAMEFVIQTLGPNDRLSIVNFNSNATPLHGLLKMNSTNQGTATAAIRSLHATGGTDILDGMRSGWSILENRKTKNPASCMFLLTDGQDRDNTAEKLNLARSMKSAGTSLFVFGFGTDHDSEHMDAIANAAEGVFTYVESDNMVTDAFGGTIGAQQGQSLSNITLSLQACERDVRITQVLSGRYPHALLADGRAASVSFVNMFLGESREVLVKLSVPAVTDTVLDYELVRTTATFRVQGETAAVPLREAQLPATCVVQRLSADRLNPALTRDMEVDVQLNRLQVTAAVDSALKDADAGRMDAARATLTSARIVLLASVSHQAKHLTALSLLQEVDDALSRVQSRAEYDRGGRAMMQECVSSNAYQRSTYNKAGRIAKFQTSHSASMQQQASSSSHP